MEGAMSYEAYTEAWGSVLSSESKTTAYIEEITKKDAEIGAFLEFDPNKGKTVSADTKAAGNGLPALSGIPFAIKDNIALKDFTLTCGSAMLREFVSPYCATAVQKIIDAGAVPVGKLNLDEFGMGSGTENSALRRTVNPWDSTRVPGGSSGGSAAAVAAGMVPFALGSDTGGSVRQPANFCGVYGLKPTYGAVSRYGLVAYASSLECIGVISDTVEMTETVFNCMRGADPMDQTSREAPGSKISGKDRPLTIGVLEGTEGLDEAVRQGYLEAIEQCRALGWSVTYITLDTLRYVVPAYYTIASAEASANLARYTGIRYGHRSDEMYDVASMTRKTREEGFGPEVKLRILLGTYVLRSGFQDQYYVRAQKIRTKIRHDMAQAFGMADLLMMPVFPTQAYPLGGEVLTPFQQKLADRYTITANLAGIPAMSIPTGTAHGLPVGMQFLAPEFGEELLFDAAKRYASVYTPPRAPGRLQIAEEV